MLGVEPCEPACGGVYPPLQSPVRAMGANGRHRRDVPNSPRPARFVHDIDSQISEDRGILL